MEIIRFGLTYSYFYCILCASIGALFSFILYKHSQGLPAFLRKILFVSRAIVVALLCFLLLEPFFNIIKNEEEKPIIALLIDNSESVARAKAKGINIEALLQQIKDAQRSIIKAGYQPELFTLDGKIESVDQCTFTESSTNIYKALSQLKHHYRGKNLGSVMVLSDGIYNTGEDPSLIQLAAPIYTVGLGDTVPSKDVRLVSVEANKTVQVGNDVQIAAFVSSTGYSGKTVSISIEENNVVLKSVTKQIHRNRAELRADFLIPCPTKATRHFIVKVSGLDGETNTRNNIQHIFVEVVDQKDKVLILAQSPHPDVKSIQLALEQNARYSTEVVFTSFSKPDFTNKYALIILHQLPTQGVMPTWLQSGVIKETPILWIVGNQTDLLKFNHTNSVVVINKQQGLTDEVQISFSNQFENLLLEKETKAAMENAPPLFAPFGQYRLKSQASVIAHQRIGNQVSDRPLIAFSDGAVHQAVIAGEGIWKWRMAEYQETGGTTHFDAWMNQFIQLMARTKVNKALSVLPTQESYWENETPSLAIETKNELGQPLYDKPVDIQVTDEKGKKSTFTFITNQEQRELELPFTKSGVYKVTASALFGDKKQTTSASFKIKPLDVELNNLTANHEVLKELAARNQGAFSTSSSWLASVDQITKQNIPSKIHSHEEKVTWIHLKWIFFILLLLLSIEWFARKWNSIY